MFDGRYRQQRSKETRDSMNKRIVPVRIVCEENTINGERLLEESGTQASLVPLEWDKERCTIIESGGYIMFDFGKEIRGGIALTIHRIADKYTDGKCRIVFGESVREAMSSIGEKNATNQHGIRDSVLDITYLSTNNIGGTGFRFVKIEALDDNLYIHSVLANCDIADLEYKGSFECNDERLNEIWKVGAYTVQLNTGEYIWDGIKRDRLVWIGDMHPETSTINAVFGDIPAVRNSLDFAKSLTPPDEWMNNTATYSMWWIIIHYDYYMHWGDIGYLKEQEEYLIPLCEHIIEWAEDDFDANPNEMPGFVDWSSKFSESEVEGRHAIATMSLDCAAKIFEQLGNKEYKERCGAYADRLKSEKITKESNKRISALTILSGRDADIAKTVLAGDSAKEMSCFMGYYVLRAKAKLGDVTEALNIIRSYWGAMLDKGATTFWEEFDMDWVDGSGRIDEITPEGLKDIHGDHGKYCYKGLRLSLCHGWAGGPTPFLTEQVGGIEILEPGFKKVRINPNLGDLKWIKVTYPTPYGKIKINAENKNGKTEFTYNAPDEIEVVCK